jgi:NAD(P)-dependent dehydrogenase (short-subunit alcohol dehydrogenase family)
MNGLAGKTAIVTGASSGIGRASAEALAKAGFTVFGTSRRPPPMGLAAPMACRCWPAT